LSTIERTRKAQFAIDWKEPLGSQLTDIEV
jgi:hypothetical protein